jgi:hypothetical protein
MKLCNLCGEETTEEFKRCAACRAKLAAKHQVWRTRRKAHNPEAHQAWTRDKNRRPCHLRAVRNYKQRNRATKYRKLHNDASRDWRRAHRAECRLRYQLYKAVKQGEIVKPTACEKCEKEGVRLYALLAGPNIHSVEWDCARCHSREVGIASQ